MINFGILKEIMGGEGDPTIITKDLTTGDLLLKAGEGYSKNTALESLPEDSRVVVNENPGEGMGLLGNLGE